MSKHLAGEPRSAKRQEELKEEFTTGPLSILQQSVRNNTQVLIHCRNNRKLLGCVRAFDRHCNMVLENVKEMWFEVPRNEQGRMRKGKDITITKEQFIKKMFLRGDNVILVIHDPPAPALRQHTSQ